ncbi:MAG: hypothetical protein LVS60_13205 [Nodosilinea sp. LVE1205-7]
MSKDLPEWIAAIETLQSQLTETCQQRDQAHKSAANWQRLYEIEASQRRQEAEQFQGRIDQLQVQLKRLVQPPQLQETPSDPSLAQQVTQLQARCNRLSQELQAEQRAHAQTRQSLTAALGETLEQLKGNRLQPP